MNRIPIKLEDKHTRQGGQRGQLVDAVQCLDVPAALIAQTVARWAPLAGFSPAADETLGGVAAAFSARLEPVAPLEPREQEALSWFRRQAFRTPPKSVVTD